MRSSIKTVLDRYQVRKTPKQKEAFRTFLNTHAKKHEYEVSIQKYSKKGHNLIIGSPASAKLILTAHYDTPPNFFIPIVASVGGIVPWTLSQFIPLIPLLAILSIPRLLIKNPLASAIASEAFLIAYAIQIVAGIPNKHNANDNTSGVAVLLSLLEDLPHELREKICFVFFDDEEKGLIGANKFKKAYGSQVAHKPLINFDCVAHGSHFVFSAKKAFRNSQESDSLEESLAALLHHKDYSYGSALKHIYTSDQLLFKNSVGVAAAHKLPLVGPVLNRIHTRQDNKFDEGNIEVLKTLIMDFTSKL